MCSRRTCVPSRRDERRRVDPADLGPVRVDLREHRWTDHVEQVLERGPAVDDRCQLELVVVIAEGDAPCRRELLSAQQLVRERSDRRQVGEPLGGSPRARRAYRRPAPAISSRISFVSPSTGSRRCAATAGETQVRHPAAHGPRIVAQQVRVLDAEIAGPARRAPGRSGSPGRPPHAGSRAGVRWEGDQSCARVCHCEPWT